MTLWNFIFNRNKQSGKIYNYCKFIEKSEKTNNKLKTQLIMMLDGNISQADELIAKARFADPGKSDTYYYYKAIVKLKKINFPETNF